MSELKSVYIDRTGDWCRSGNDTGKFYLKSEVDKVIESITKGAMSMFRKSSSCRGLDVKSPLGRIANVAFKHWMHVESVQNKNIQLQKDEDRLLECNHKLFNEVEHLKARIAEKNEELRHQKYKRCLDMAKWCFTKSNYHFVLARHGEDSKENNRRSILYSKWHNRWLELSKKFKEA